MKNGKMMRSLAAMSLVVALFATQSRAANYFLNAGGFTVTTYASGPCANPNGYPVVTVSAQLYFGFLLDGSESASSWLKTLQDASLNNRSVTIDTDDNPSDEVCGQIGGNGTSFQAWKILSVTINPF